MKHPMDQNPVSIEMLVSAIADSPIVVMPPAVPPGFEDVDLVILTWLADEAARMRSRGFVLMQ